MSDVTSKVWAESKPGSVSPSRGRARHVWRRRVTLGALLAFALASGGCSSERGPRPAQSGAGPDPSGASASGGSATLGESGAGPLATAGSDSAQPTVLEPVVSVAPPVVVPPYVSAEAGPERFP